MLNKSKTPFTKTRPTNPKLSYQNPDKMVFRISKPGQTSSGKSSTSSKQQKEQNEQKPEKNSVLLEYKQFVESLQKAGPSAMLLDNSINQIGIKLFEILAYNLNSHHFKK